MYSAVLDRKASDRGPTTELWKGIPEPGCDPRFGVCLFDDMHDLATGNWTATQATAGTWALDTTVGDRGVALADCNSTTATQGINVQRPGWAVAPAAGKIIAYEGLLKAADIATGPEFFWGLSVVDTTLIASSANSSADHVGFESVTDNNILLFHTEDGGTRVSGATSPHTLVDDTYVKLGFRIIGLTAVEVYVNGSIVNVAFSATPDIPEGSILVPSLVCQTGGTTDPIVHLDWIRMGWTP